jgi:hypothetical protein
METGSNLNIPNSCKRKLLFYAVCNNNPQYIELWVQLGTTVNYQGHRNMTELSVAVVMEGYLLFYCNAFYFNIVICF